MAEEETVVERRSQGVELTHDTKTLVCTFIAANNFTAVEAIAGASREWSWAARDPLVWGELVEHDLPDVHQALLEAGEEPQEATPFKIYSEHVKRPKQDEVERGWEEVARSRGKLLQSQRA